MKITCYPSLFVKPTYLRISTMAVFLIMITSFSKTATAGDGNSLLKTSPGVSGIFTVFSDLTGFCKGGCRNNFAEDRQGNVWIYGKNGLRMFDGTKLVTPDLSKVITTDEILIIRSDTSNVLWVGTANELVRFDGSAWKKFGKDDGLTEGKISYIDRTPSGELIFDDRYGSYHFDNGRFTRITPQGSDGKSRLQYFFTSQSGRIWYIQDGRSLCVQDGEMLKMIKKDLLPADFLGFGGSYILTINSKEEIYFAQGSKLFRFDIGKNQLEELLNVGGAFSDAYISDITTDSSGKVWVTSFNPRALPGRAGVLYTIEGTSVSNVKMESDKEIPRCIFKDSNHRLWLSATTGMGKFRMLQLDSGTWKPIFSVNEDFRVVSMFEDSKGNKWFSGTPKGRFILWQLEK